MSFCVVDSASAILANLECQIANITTIQGTAAQSLRSYLLYILYGKSARGNQSTSMLTTLMNTGGAFRLLFARPAMYRHDIVN